MEAMDLELKTVVMEWEEVMNQDLAVMLMGLVYKEVQLVVLTEWAEAIDLKVEMVATEWKEVMAQE